MSATFEDLQVLKSAEAMADSMRQSVRDQVLAESDAGTRLDEAE